MSITYINLAVPDTINPPIREDIMPISANLFIMTNLSIQEVGRHLNEINKKYTSSKPISKHEYYESLDGLIDEMTEIPNTSVYCVDTNATKCYIVHPKKDWNDDEKITSCILGTSKYNPLHQNDTFFENEFLDKFTINHACTREDSTFLTIRFNYDNEAYSAEIPKYRIAEISSEEYVEIHGYEASLLLSITMQAVSIEDRKKEFEDPIMFHELFSSILYWLNQEYHANIYKYNHLITYNTMEE